MAWTRKRRSSRREAGSDDYGPIAIRVVWERTVISPRGEGLSVIFVQSGSRVMANATCRRGLARSLTGGKLPSSYATNTAAIDPLRTPTKKRGAAQQSKRCRERGKA